MCSPWLKTNFRSYHLLHVTFARFSLVVWLQGSLLDLAQYSQWCTWTTLLKLPIKSLLSRFSYISFCWLWFLNMELSDKHPYLKTTTAHTARHITCNIQQCFKMLTNPDLPAASLKSLIYSVSIQDSITNSLHPPLELLWETDPKIHSRSWGSTHGFLTRTSETKKVAFYWVYANATCKLVCVQSSSQLPSLGE